MLDGLLDVQLLHLATSLPSTHPVPKGLSTMSLNFDLTAVENWQEVAPELREAVIFGCMAVGIGSLDSDKNIEEYVERIDFLQRLNGAFLSEPTDDGWQPRPITREDVESLRGLKTNVFPRESRTSFIKRHTAPRPGSVFTAADRK